MSGLSFGWRNDSVPEETDESKTTSANYSNPFDSDVAKNKKSKKDRKYYLATYQNHLFKDLRLKRITLNILQTLVRD